MTVPAEMATVARYLGDLRERVVFVGGMIRPLLITDPAVEAARPTKDVDLIVDVGSRVELYALEARLRSLGFSQLQEEWGTDLPLARRWRSSRRDAGGPNDLGVQQRLVRDRDGAPCRRRRGR